MYLVKLPYWATRRGFYSRPLARFRLAVSTGKPPGGYWPSTQGSVWAVTDILDAERPYPFWSAIQIELVGMLT